ncbi:MAG: hypothetical protein PHE83_16615 [Opitutaceae bacterium]|nr:hypothetical protein [Opitutaceae bacterium]
MPNMPAAKRPTPTGPREPEPVIGGKWTHKATGRPFALSASDQEANELRLVSTQDGDHWRGTLQEALTLFSPGRAALA